MGSGITPSPRELGNETVILCQALSAAPAEFLGGSQADAAVAAGDDGNLVRESAHVLLLFSWVPGSGDLFTPSGGRPPAKVASVFVPDYSTVRVASSDSELRVVGQSAVRAPSGL